MAKRLKRSFNELSSTKGIGDFLRDFQAETDRGTTIVAAAYLDDLLEVMFRKHFAGKSEKLVDTILSENGPLGTFSSRIKLAYCLDLIRDDQFSDLEIVRNIRNEFSHQHADLRFDAQPICDLCDNFHQVAIANSDDEQQQALFEMCRQNRRMKFIGTAVHLACGLMIRINAGEKLDFET
jgi:DNA-binding MltR family transcriptional regulator